MKKRTPLPDRQRAMQAKCPTCSAIEHSLCLDFATGRPRPQPHHARYFAAGATPPAEDEARR